ncbi:MAG: response regulator [Gemmatimonadetes bacterium]|nr:response regulator [Gemmatimonadota bacterium]
MDEATRVLIVDDEALARERTRSLLAQVTGVELVGECSTGLQAVHAIEQHAPDIVFLDVQMPELDGLGVIEALTPERCPQIVFVTAYDRYMERAFEMHAVDYLRKPYTDERFFKALEHARLRAREHRICTASGGPGLRSVLQDLHHSARAVSRLVIREREKGVFHVLQTEDVDWIEASETGVDVHVGKNNFPWRTTLAEVERRLDPAVFLRLHRSFIVNSTRICTVEPLWKGEYVVGLENGRKLSTGRSYRAIIETFLERA